MNKHMQQAEAMRASIDGLAEGQSDEKLIDNMAAFQHWNPNGVYYSADMLLQYDGGLYRVVQAHRSQADWTPDRVPALFARVSVEEYPDWVQPTGAHDAYGKGDKVAHNGKHWQSDIDGNVWEPGTVAGAWSGIE